ncbi:MAG: D-TA family PLP-dependent enzyme [Planctomycetaceae bacterium]|nr:D-TA family PLP-dependent enzyme [Planctomycetaceae bacterium]
MPSWYEIENADQIPSPTILLYPDRIRENLLRMIQQAGDVNRLRPHVKTHKLPQVVALKRELGIHKFKASTIAEAEMTAAAGGEDILLAYQPTGPNIARLLRLIETFPASRFSSIVDDADNLRQISAAAVASGHTVPLLVDLDVGMQRTGIVPERAAELYRLLQELPGVSPAGLHAYDGHLHDVDHEKLERSAQAAFAPVWELRAQLLAEGLPVPVVVASGTPTFPILLQQGGVEVGCGTTVLWDFGQPQISPDLDFLNAAVLLTRVISKPRGSRLCLDLGHKSVASEMPQPRVRLFGLEEAQVVGHNEEHLVLETPLASRYRVGDVVYGIPRHICPTMALHQEVWPVQNRQALEPWPVVARVRRITL